MTDLDAILAIELDGSSSSEQLKAWSQLVKSGTYRHLQGFYQRGVRDLIANGILSEDGDILIALSDTDTDTDTDTEQEA
jgi:hypothetical protein